MQPDPSSHRHEQETFGGGEAASGALFEGDSPAHRASTVPADESNGIGRVGRYTLLRVIGQGGMGSVYLAQQDVPRRVVALKLLRPELLTPALLRRFEMESQTLARLQHPGIAQIYDAGAAQTAAGAQPFFAMEYIKGRSLVEYAAAAALTLPQRLELFIRVCDAVQHAHAKGVVHRDLKPANILVTEQGEPKILDFGVARLTDKDVAGATMHTEVGQLVGTLPYMSPEQVAGVPDDVDTRSDVYALGVVLFELLTGRLPYEVAGKMVPEAARIIREEDPTRLSSVNRHYRGDVETIVGKALEKDRLRRYQTAAALSADLGRYLRDEPIVARPSTTWYQVRKFAQRHRALVGGLAAVFVVLVAGVVVSQMLLARALLAENRAHDEARQAGIAREHAESLRTRADRSAARATAIADVLRSIITSANPNRTRRSDVTMREALDSALVRVRAQLAHDPEILSAVLTEAGEAFVAMEDSARGREVLRDALEVTRKHYGERSAEFAQSLWNLAGAATYTSDDTNDAIRRESRRLLLEAAGIFTALFGESDPRVGQIMGDVSYLDRLAEESHANQSTQGPGRQPGSIDRLEPNQLSLSDRLFFQGWSFSTGGRVSAADLLQRVRSLGNSVRSSWVAGRRDEAVAALTESLRRWSAEASIDPERMWAVAGAVGQRQRLAGDLAVAEAVLVAVTENLRREGNSPDVFAIALNELGLLLSDLGRNEDAVSHAREALRVNRELNPGATTRTLLLLRNLIEFELLAGDLEAARRSTMDLLSSTSAGSSGSVRSRVFAYQVLEWLETQAGNVQAAAEAASRADAEDPERKYRFKVPLSDRLRRPTPIAP